MKKKILFIINPNSGHKRGADIIELIPQYIDSSKFEYSYELTTHGKHAIDIASRAVQNNIDIVAAVGGDGLVNEVFQNLVNTDVAFTVIPIGSGNGVARSLGIPMNIKKAIEQLKNGKLTKIDTVLFNDQPYLGVAGIGFDGFIAWEFAKIEKRGFWSYVKLIIKQMKAFRSSAYIVKDGKNEWSFNAFIVTIANGQQYGNNAFVAPEAKLNNGQLDLVIVKKHLKWLSPLLAIQVMTGNINKSRHVETIRASKFEINTSYTYAHIDGEPILAKTRNYIEVLPSSLNIFS